jgi:hypothetical protein
MHPRFAPGISTNVRFDKNGVPTKKNRHPTLDWNPAMVIPVL